LRDEPDVDVDRATTRSRQPRPDFADHYDVRTRDHRVKGGDLGVVLATDDTDELCLRCIGSISVVRRQAMLVHRGRAPYRDDGRVQAETDAGLSCAGSV